MPACAPSTVTVGGVHYTLATDVAVVPLGPGEAPARALLVDEDAGLAVVETAGARGARRLERPVYRAEPSGAIALPTGRVFVRFAEGDRAESHRDALARAGFAIDAVPDWAPHAAWVRAAGGGVADALAGLDALGREPGVVHAEPELLRARAQRGS